MLRGLTLSIVIPAYNEERRLPSTLDGVLRWLDQSPHRNAEVLVVDDGSRDGTAALVRTRAAADSRGRRVQNPGNRGKGCSGLRGMTKSRGDWMLSSVA